WRFRSGAARDIELKLQPKSILKWANPGMGRVHGGVYIWTADGRPEVVMALFKVWDPVWGFQAEMHSLSQDEMTVDRDAKAVGQPDQPGPVWKDVPDAPEAAATAARRLQQMRALARDFTATLIDYRRNDSGERQELRLLPQPVYRYETTSPDVLDGTLFTFVF